MYRTRRRNDKREVLSPLYPRHPLSNRRYTKPVSEEKTRAASPDPTQHAKALVEGFGIRTALQIAQFNAQLVGPNGSYWADVLDNVVNAWGCGVGDFAKRMGHLPHADQA